MSLAQKIERPLTGPTAVPSPPLPKVSAPIDLRQLIRRPVAVAPVPVAPAAVLEAKVERPTPDVALDLLNQVSTALPALMDRCQALEATLATSREQSRIELEAAAEFAREWQQVAQSLKVQVEQLEGDVAVMRQRAEAVEAESATVKALAEKSQHAAAEAECLSSLFQEKVLTAFGAGSPSHSILESVRNRTQAMLSA